MPLIRPLLALLFVGGSIACGTDLVAPSTVALAGRWSRMPSAHFARTLEFTANGAYVHTDALRGIYPQLPADSAGNIEREYGTYVVHDDTLRFAQDSVRSWDYLRGASLHLGSSMYFEGRPTDPAMELTSTRLTLRYMVNPGSGYVPFVEEYLRDR